MTLKATNLNTALILLFVFSFWNSACGSALPVTIKEDVDLQVPGAPGMGEMNKSVGSYQPLLAANGSMEKAGVAKGYPGVGKVHVYLNELADLVDSTAVVEKLTDDRFSWSEGPVWVSEGDYLLFSDVPKNTLWKWTEAGGLEVFRQPSAMPVDAPGDGGEGTNGLILDGKGGIIAGDHGSRALIRIDLATGEPEALVSKFEDKRFSSPNDVVMSKKRWPGKLFFTDPPYGLKDQDDSDTKELDFNGVYRLDPDGTLELLSGSLGRPNGVVLTPDESELIVANSQAGDASWTIFSLDDNGSVAGEGREFANAQSAADSGAKGLPDGMAVDIHGNIFATGPGGVLVFDPDGKLLGLIETGTAIANCAFGGSDGSVLYMTSHSFLARVQTNTRGIEFQ